MQHNGTFFDKSMYMHMYTCAYTYIKRIHVYVYIFNRRDTSAP